MPIRRSLQNHQFSLNGHGTTLKVCEMESFLQQAEEGVGTGSLGSTARVLTGSKRWLLASTTFSGEFLGKESGV